MIYEGKILWIYIAFLLTFGELLGLFFPKMFLRVIYIALMIWIFFKHMYKREFRLRLENFDKLIFLYIFYMTLLFVWQCITGNLTSSSLVSFIQTIVPVLLFFIAKGINDDDASDIEQIYAFFSALSIGLGIINKYFKFLPSTGTFAGGLYAYVGENSYEERAYSMAGSALITGFISALLVCFIIDKFEKRPLKMRLLNFVLLIIGILGCLLSLSRGAIAFLGIFCICYVFLSRKNRLRMIKKRIVLSTLFVFFIGVFFVTSKWESIKNSSIYNRFVTVGVSQDEASNAGRIEFQQEAIAYIKKKPICGMGFGYSGYQASVADVDTYINAESYIILLGINSGIIGITLFVLIFLRVVCEACFYEKKYIYKYVSLIVGMFAWSVMYILLESDLIAIFYWYSIGRVFSKEKRMCQKVIIKYK